MINFNYRVTGIGWLGFLITLTILLTLNKCGASASQIIEKKTEIHNYYDSSVKVVPLKYSVPGTPIFVPVPSDVDTAKILALYFSKNPYARVFSNDTVTISLYDTISQNKFKHPGLAKYNWHLPIKTVESTTVTVESPKKIQVLAGGHVNFNQNIFMNWGPDIYLQTKRGQLFGLGYNVPYKTNPQSISIKAALNLNDAFRNKKK